MKKLWKFSKKTLKYGLVFLVLLLLLSRFVIPEPDFKKPFSTVVFSQENQLLGARIAKDGQWRFPESDSIPVVFEHCILTFEDQQFYRHLGINPVSIFRALKENFQAGKVKQGGSTLTMQLARIHQGNKKRTVWQKVKEMFIAMHMEVNWSKERILNLYCSHAPFGGNVVGLDAAAWRYFNRPVSELTLSECASLAVLPNSPSLIFPGKNEELLRNKRNRLLSMLLQENRISQEDYELALIENLPGKPHRLPNYAKHLTDRAAGKNQGKPFKTSIQYKLQKRLQNLVNQHAQINAHNEIYNAAAVVLDTKTGEVLAYIGNSTNSAEHGNLVDVTTAPRSTGSTLKPFLYAFMLSKGELLPTELVTDVPTYISGYSPKNYHKTFDGVVPANEALYRSLNVPFVRLLQSHGSSRFHAGLKSINMNTLNHGAGHYGLSLILGGAECKLTELTSMYAGLGRVLLEYEGSSEVKQSQFFTSSALQRQPESTNNKTVNLKPSAIFETLETLTESKRPVDEFGWKRFGSSNKIAWKTGTSFGNRDAWSVGVTPEYTVGIWIGNADGEGRFGLTGLGYAAPLMFDVFKELPATSWFEKPYDDYKQVEICTESGRVAKSHCSHKTKGWIPDIATQPEICQNHQLVHLTADRLHRTNQSCVGENELITESWFVLKPAEEWYYKNKSATYRSLPSFKPGCEPQTENSMEFIYPKPPYRIYLPKYFTGEEGVAVFELAHRDYDSEVFWYLDNVFIGSTKGSHKKEINADKGVHTVLVTDELGEEMVVSFEVL